MIRFCKRIPGMLDMRNFYSAPPGDDTAFSFRSVPMTLSVPRSEVGMGAFGAQWFKPLLTKSKYNSILDWCCGAGVFGIGMGYVAKVSSATFCDIDEGRLAIARDVHFPLNKQSSSVPNARLICSDGLASVKGNYDLIVGSPPWFDSPDDPAIRELGHPQQQDTTFYVCQGGSLYIQLLDAVPRLSAGKTELCFFGVNMTAKLPVFLEASTTPAAKFSSVTIEPVWRNIESVHMVYEQ